MSNTYKHEGRRITYTNSSGSAMSAGRGVPIRSGNSGFIGFLVNDIANGATGPAEIEGVHEKTAETGAGQSWTLGQVIYWDNTNQRFTATASGNTLAGAAAAAKTTAAATGQVKLAGH